LDLALVAIILFVLVMFTRRRLDAVEKRALMLEVQLTELHARVQQSGERHEGALAELSEQIAELSAREPLPAEVQPTTELAPGRDAAASLVYAPRPAASESLPPGAAAAQPASGGLFVQSPLSTADATSRDALSGSAGQWSPSDAHAASSGAAPRPADIASAPGGSADIAGAVARSGTGSQPSAADTGSATGRPGDPGSATGGSADVARGAERSAGGSQPSAADPGSATGRSANVARGAERSAGGSQPSAAEARSAQTSRGRPHAHEPAVAAALSFAKELLFGGNTVVRVGILILLIGVVLLLRWAAEHAILPIELRLVGTALLAIALIVVGFRQRSARPGFSRTLQGGGIAGLYLVVFFAFRTYGLIPAPLAFALLVGIAAASAALAVLQDSRSLIMIAQVFGFAAPLLASTGQGSHVGLFSYYLVLNLAVAGVAWFKAWRALNLLGFAFTFGVASAWGVLRYEPQHFASTEPFLIAFFLLYVSIPLLYALRHPGSPRGWVDGSLVFGTPLAALGLQWSLVHDRSFAMAFTALGMATIYLGLALVMKRRAPERLAMLGEAFLPIGVGFATLAIPYGIDSHNLTGAAWALEGAGLYWIGVRQSRALSRAAGVVLQLLAGGALALDPQRPQSALPLLNSWFLAGTLIGLSSLFIAYYGQARRASRVEVPMLAYGLLFVFAMGHGELDAWVPEAIDPGARIAWFGLLGLVLELSAGKLAWHTARYPGLLLWLAMFGLLAHHHVDLDVSPLARGGYFGWPILALAMVLILRRFTPRAPAIERFAHPIALWLWTAWLISLAQHALRALELDSSYLAAVSLAIGVFLMLSVLRLSRGASWPIGVHRELYLGVAAGGVALAALLGVLAANLTEGGSSAPLPYLPVLNALDIAILLTFAVLLAWMRRASHDKLLLDDLRNALVSALALLAFISWNGLLARSVHHYGGVPFDASALWGSVALQVAFSLSWTLIALGVMLVAHRQRARPVWWAGAGLLTLVVLKLFLLDLAELSAPAKIGTFLGVGLLLLIVGALAPVPPSADPVPEEGE
jgi:uncharacterized membrane protein